MKYAFDTNIYQIWRNINDPDIQKNDVLKKIHNSSWHVIYETEELHKEAVAIGSRHGGLGAADLLLAATAKHEKASVVTIDSDFKGLKNEIEVIVLSSIADLL